MLWVGQQKVVDQLLTPLDDASDNMKGEHPKRVQNVDTLIEELGVTLLVLTRDVLDTKAD